MNIALANPGADEGFGGYAGLDGPAGFGDGEEPTTEKPGLIANIITSPISGIRDFLQTIIKLLIKLVEGIKTALTKLSEGLEELLTGAGDITENLAEKAKCIIQNPLKFLDCL